jgi:hypothetical protein
MAVGLPLDDFRGAVKEVARPNRFLMSLVTPPLIKGVVIDENAQYLVRTASLPARAVGEITNVYWQGMNYKLAGDPSYENVAFSFLNNSNFNLKQVFEKWMDGIANTITNERLKPSDYKAIIQIQQLSSKDSTVIGTYNLHGAYPLSLDAVELSQETIDAVEEFTVQISVDYWSNDPKPGEGAGIVNTDDNKEDA